MAYYVPPKKFKREKVEDLDITDVKSAKSKKTSKGDKDKTIETNKEDEMPEFELGNEELNNRAVEIWKVREKIRKKFVDKSPDKESSKGRKKKAGKNTSHGRNKSLDGSAADMSATNMSGPPLDGTVNVS